MEILTPQVAPTSPNACSSPVNDYFYSLPNSPTEEMSKSSFGSEGKSPSHEDSYLKNEDFEFESSKRFIFDGSEFGSPMSFADELFFNGQVLPLNPPPGFHQSKFGNNMSPPPSPKSPSRILKFQFLRQNLWNDDYDPFTAALQNVTEEEREKPQHKRARSNLPLPAISSQGSIDSLGPKHSISARWALQQGANPNQFPRPNGLDSGTNVRPITPNQAILAGSTEKDRKEQMGSRRQRMKVFLRNASLKKEKNQGVTVWKPQHKRSFSIRAMSSALCLGFGSKGKTNKKH